VKTTSANDAQNASMDTPGTGSGRHTVLNWVLAILTVPAALAVVGFSYLQVLGTAGCSGGTCAKTGPSETVFGLIMYGTPAVAVVTIALSLITARRRWGIVVPAVAFGILAVATIILITTF
jgi:hypothetical protein